MTLYGHIVSWNTGAQEVYGYTGGEASGQPFSALALPEQADEMFHLLKLIRHGERIKHFKTMHLRHDGQVISVPLSLPPIIDPFGRIFGVSAIARDMTPRLRSEKAHREAVEKCRLLSSAQSDAIILV